MQGRSTHTKSTAVKRLLIAGLTLGLLGTGVYWFTRSAPRVTAPVLFEVKTSDLTSKITQVGEIRSLESVTIRAQKDGPIAYLVPEGTLVNPGDVLVRFDPTQYEAALTASKVELSAAVAELRRAQSDLEAQQQKLLSELARLDAEARLAEVDLTDLKKKPLQEEVEKARLELEKAKVTFEHAERKRKVLPELAEKGFITRSTLDEAEVNYVTGKASLQIAQVNFDKVSAGATAEELEKATIKLTQARFAFQKAESASGPFLRSLEAGVEREKANVQKGKHLVERARSDLARTQLRAPQAGLAVHAKEGGSGLSRKIYPGMMAFAGQNLIYLPDMSTMVVDAEVNEFDIGKVQAGAPVEVRLEADPASVFHGRVFQVATLSRLKPGPAGTDSKIKVFDVTAKIEEKDPRLKPGLSATLDFIVEHQRDVISIPLSAVVSRGGEPFVLVANSGRVEERKVILGTSNDERVVVKEGLRPGEQVVLAPASGPR